MSNFSGDLDLTRHRVECILQAVRVVLTRLVEEERTSNLTIFLKKGRHSGTRVQVDEPVPDAPDAHVTVNMRL